MTMVHGSAEGAAAISDEARTTGVWGTTQLPRQASWRERRSCAEYYVSASLGADRWYTDFEIMAIENPVLAAYACRAMANRLERHREKHDAIIAAAEKLEARAA